MLIFTARLQYEYSFINSFFHNYAFWAISVTHFAARSWKCDILFFSFPCPPVLQGLSNDADLTSLWPNPWPNLTEIWDFLQNYPHIFLLFGYPIIRTHVSFISSLHLDPPFSEFSQGKSALSIPPKYHYYLKFKFWVHIGYLFYCSWDMSVISFHVRTNIIIMVDHQSLVGDM